ncbi:glutathione S-transferase [Fistulina hepatica ATCC 64428]|uniref:glutathione transferase n=1 Tax=Fistulina hepatica ATCC 64428 TaxID=1128425 RepID=A0A0D7A8B0_9AGAR|nr:glutathione S-transferase [Fistulina hepatica ATCC 64428]
MVLKLYGSVGTPSTKRVAIVLHEKQIPYELVKMDYSLQEHRADVYLEKNPFGLMPYLDDDGYIIYESRAICRYLEMRYTSQGVTLIPTEVQAHGQFEEAASIELCHFDQYASPIFRSILGLETYDEDHISKMIKMLNTTLDIYEKILGKQKYLAGEEITLADLFHLPLGAPLTAVLCDLMTARPNVARWWADLTLRKSWKAVKDGTPRSLSSV